MIAFPEPRCTIETGWVRGELRAFGPNGRLRLLLEKSEWGIWRRIREWLADGAPK